MRRLSFRRCAITISSLSPTAPVVLNIAEDSIRNLLIVNTPPVLKAAITANESRDSNPLDVDPLVAVSLANQLDNDPAAQLDQNLLPNLLDQEFVNDIVKRVQKQIAGAPKITAQPVAVAEATVSKTEIVLPVDNAIDIPANGETTKYLASTDITNNVILIKRNEYESARILIEQNGQELANSLNVGGSTVIIIRQVNR